MNQPSDLQYRSCSGRKSGQRSYFLLTFVLALVLLSSSHAVFGANGERVAILAGNVLNVERGQLQARQLIVVEGGKILSIENVSDEVEFDIDLSAYTVLPGLIDAHAHLTDNSYMGAEFDHWSLPAASFGIVGTVNARKTLLAGFTTVRDVSSPFFASLALRDAINLGWTEGPRMFVSGAMITMTGGHGAWGNWIAPQHNVDTQAHAIADGADEVRRAVREQIKHNVDVIKVAATGGFGTHGTIPAAASYTLEELRAAVEEASKRGLTVAAHAHGAQGIKNAVLAGVTSIEHVTLADKEAIELMRDHKVYAVMDLLAAHYDLIERKADFSSKQLSGSNAEEFDNYLSRFAEVYKAGVPMAFGTDSGIYPHGRNAEQFGLMVRAGASPADAIRMATVWAARLLGAADEVGTIAVGKSADLIAVQDNPLKDVTTLEKVVFVMRQGQVYKKPKHSD